jgi:hypothetical protein
VSLVPEIPSQAQPGDKHGDRLLLTYLAVAMVATGQPVHEIDEDLDAVGRRLGYPDLQVAAGPTGSVWRWPAANRPPWRR